MFWTDFFEKFFKKTKMSQGVETVIVDIPTEIYYGQLALYTARTLLANALAQSEYVVYENNVLAPNHPDGFTLNVSPNPNQNATMFWNKVLRKMFGPDNKALVVELNGHLYVADSYTVERELPLVGDIYSGVTIGNLQLNRKFNAREIYLFQVSDAPYCQILTGITESFTKLISIATQAFKRDGCVKYKLHIDATREGSEDFQREFEETIQKQLEEFLEPGDAALPEFDGYDLKTLHQSSPSSVSAKNILDIKDAMFNMVSDSLGIPRALMNGNINNIEGVLTEFITFAVKPIANMIVQALNKRSGPDNWSAGNRYGVNLNGIIFRDILAAGDKVDKLFASGTTSIDENRALTGLPVTGEDWAQEHYVSKNYDRTNAALSKAGGEDDG